MSSSSIEIKIKKERMKLLYNYSILSIVALLLIGSTLIWQLSGQVPRVALVWWGVSFCIILFLRIAFAVFYHYSKHHLHLLTLNYSLFIIGTSLLALLWGVLGSLLMPYEFHFQLLVMLVIAGITACALLVLLPSYLASILYIILSLLPLFAWLIFQSLLKNTHYFKATVVVGIYLVVLLFVGRLAHVTFFKNLKLRFEKSKQSQDSLSNIYKLQEINKVLKESESRFRSSFDFAAIGMAIVSIEGRWLKVNQTLCRILGYSEKELLTMDFQRITYPEDLAADLNYLQQLLNGKISSYVLEKRFIKKNGNIVWILLTVSLVRDADNKPLYLISQMQDIDVQKKEEQQLKEIAFHDPLTGLANRKQLEISFDLASAYANRHHINLIVLFLDLDYFKRVNDEQGHDVGDMLLKVVAQRLQKCMRAIDIVARLGGDEFIIVITEVLELDGIMTVIKKIQEVISEPISIKDQTIHITVSIGASVYPSDGKDLETLIQNADKAMYSAKLEGRNRYKLGPDLTP